MTWEWPVAFLPIAVVLVGMIALKWSGARAGAAAWLAALAISALAFGAGPALLGYAQIKSLLLSLYVLYIVWAALLFYHVVNQAGVIKTFATLLPGLTCERGTQALILAWAFGSFLQGIAGYGVPTAVVAPLLVGLGIGAGTAVVAAGIGHAWAVTFGSLAASFLALMAATGRAGPELAAESALLLGLTCFLCGIVVLWATGGWASIRAHWWEVLIAGGVMSGVQFGLALLGIYTLAAAVAGLAGLGALVVVARLRPSPARSAPAPGPDRPSLGRALFPYLLLIAIVGSANLIPAVGDFLDRVSLNWAFPELATARGYITPAGPGRSISVFGHPGALLIYTAVICFFIFRARGVLPAGAGAKVLRLTYKSALNATLGIATMVAMAVTMEHAGVTSVLASGLGSVAGAAFPAMSPFIGALGAFMTGSNTNSNVVFAGLQDNVARLLGYSPAIVLAAQTTGGAVGGAFAPAKVILGCSTVGLGGQEGPVVKATFAYGMAVLLVVGLVVLAWTWMG